MRKLRKTSQVWLTALAALSLVSTASAQTIIPGPTITGGTWSPSGNPYYITGDGTLAAGQTLTIQPGVVVDIAAGVTVTFNGTIQAVGTASQRITFQSFIPSEFWSTIVLNGTAATNQFNYCDFWNATTALDFQYNSINQVMFSTFQNVTNGIQMQVSGGNYTQTTTILNCMFSNCVSQAVYGAGVGQAIYAGWSSYSYNSTLNLIVKNCMFNNTGNGCVLDIYGDQCNINGTYYWTGYGSAVATVDANIFRGLSGTALLLAVGSFAATSQATLINNTIVNCAGGVSAADPWDGQVLDCVFVGCTNAVQDTGSLLRNVSYNDFYASVTTNFIGYNANYGKWIIPNRNGTLSDVAGNIGQNPLFLATNDFHLATNSPCVNAGTPNTAYANMCRPPSIATNFPDLGAYGGPDACNWLPVVPMLPVQLSITNSTNQLWLSWAAIPRSSYQVQYLGTNFNATSRTNKWLTNSTVTAAGRPVSMVVSPYPATNKTFYRIQSLGRTPGN